MTGHDRALKRRRRSSSYQVSKMGVFTLIMKADISLCANDIFCCVGCTKYFEGGTIFHRFPKNKTERELWARALRVEKEVKDSDRVCGDHFTSSDYIPQAVPTKRRYLKKGVLPSQKIPVRSHDILETSPKKRQKAARRERAAKRQLSDAIGKLNIQVDDEGDESCDSNEITSYESDTDMNMTVLVSPDVMADNVKDQVSQTDRFSLITLLDDTCKLYTFTGLTSFETLDKIVMCAQRVCPENLKMVLPMKLRVALCLTKLKLNLTFTALSVLFGIQKRTCSNYFRETIQLLAYVIRGLIYWPSKEEVLDNMPKCFQKFWKTRVVLDCAEIPIERPKSLKERIMTYSNYKGRHTIKFCVCVSPAGLIVFVSSVYGGRASDKRIVVHSEVLDKLEFGDGVMVDKGFMIDKECMERHLLLIRPPFLTRKRKQLSKVDALKNAEIASARVHLERVIKQLRNFDILVDQVSGNLLPYMNDVLTVCSALVNLCPPVLALDKF